MAGVEGLEPPTLGLENPSRPVPPVWHHAFSLGYGTHPSAARQETRSQRQPRYDASAYSLLVLDVRLAERPLEALFFNHRQQPQCRPPYGNQSDADLRAKHHRQSKAPQ